MKIRDELMAKKELLEGALKKLCQDFEDDTGFKINQIDLERNMAIPKGSMEVKDCIFVDVEVTLC